WRRSAARCGVSAQSAAVDGRSGARAQHHRTPLDEAARLAGLLTGRPAGISAAREGGGQRLQQQRILPAARSVVLRAWVRLAVLVGLPAPLRSAAGDAPIWSVCPHNLTGRCADAGASARSRYPPLACARAL